MFHVLHTLILWKNFIWYRLVYFITKELCYNNSKEDVCNKVNSSHTFPRGPMDSFVNFLSNIKDPNF